MGPRPRLPPHVVLLVDIANVMGSRPDGWWRDRPRAATALLTQLQPLLGAQVDPPDELGTARISQVCAVVEGAARHVDGPEGVSVCRAERDGDSEIVRQASRLTAAGKTPLVVSADRELRRRLPEQARVAGPGWLNRLLGR